MNTADSKHEHHFCATNAAGATVCCKSGCGVSLESAGNGVKAKIARIGAWVDGNLFFANIHSQQR